jgi:hypothetical protein
MIDVIAMFLFGGFFVAFVIIIFNVAKTKHREIESMEDTPEWSEFKHGSSFVILRWNEVDWFKKLSDKEKSALVYEQGVLIKNGLIRIVEVNGEKRLISNSDYKKFKLR